MHIQRKRVLKHHPRFYGRVVFYIALLLLPIMVNNAFYRQNTSNVAGFAFTFQPHRQITNNNVTGATTTFTPGIIPFSEQEIGNPMRGPEYYGGEQSPPNFSPFQYGMRLCWKDFEPSEGNYNFSLIDNGAATAKAHGGTFGWRVMPINGSGNNCLPDYLKAVVGGPIPDFNNPFYLQRIQAMVTAFAQRYNNDPRVDILDMSYYGCWGEWNESCGDFGNNAMTEANKQKLIDIQLRTFSNKRFLMLTDDQVALDYALNVQRPKRTGVRIDCLGYASLGGARPDLEGNLIEHNQWRIAPLFFEYCSGANFALAAQDVKKYHASLLGDGDGNLQDFGSYNLADQSNIIQAFKESGYRFELNALTISNQLTAGTPFTVVSRWTNVNTAPAYIPWHVMVQLRNASGDIIWQGISQLDLTKPFSADSPGNDTKTSTDTFTLPTTVAAGSYNVSVQIIDPDNYYPPLALANTGRLSDGSYCLGTIGIGQLPTGNIPCSA